MRSGSILQTLVSKSGLTNILEVHFPDAGAGGVIVIRAKIEKEGQARQILGAAYQHLRYRWVVLVDEDCDVRDWNDIWWRIVSFCEPGDNTFIGPEHPRHLGRPGEMDFVPPLTVWALMPLASTRKQNTQCHLRLNQLWKY